MSVLNLPSSTVHSFSTKKDGEVQIRLLSLPSFPARHKEEQVTRRRLRVNQQRALAPIPGFSSKMHYPKHRRSLCSWKKANAACVTQQQPLHNCVVKYLQGWFVSTLLKHKYVSDWFITAGSIWNMKIQSFGDFHIWRYQKDGRKSPLSLHTRSSDALPGRVEALPATPLRCHQGHQLQPLNLT